MKRTLQFFCLCILFLIGLALSSHQFLVSTSYGQANGDVAIYREETGGTLITTADFDHDWDRIEREDDSYTLVGGAGGTNIDLRAGHYLVLYGARWDHSTGTQRSSILTNLDLGGVEQNAGWSMGYIRRANSADQAYTTGGAIIEVGSDGDDLILRSNRGDVRNNSVRRQGSTAGIMLLKLDDEWDYIRLSKNAQQTAPTTTTWVDVTYKRSGRVRFRILYSFYGY